MDWNISWLILGASAFLFAGVNLIRTIVFKKHSNPLMFCSLSFGAFTVLEEYRTVISWLEYGNILALETAPKLATVLSAGLWILMLLNLATLLFAKKDQKRE